MLPFWILFILIAVVVFASLETLLKLAIIFVLVMMFSRGMNCFERRFGDRGTWAERWEHRAEEIKRKRSPYV